MHTTPLICHTPPPPPHKTPSTQGERKRIASREDTGHYKRSHWTTPKQSTEQGKEKQRLPPFSHVPSWRRSQADTPVSSWCGENKPRKQRSGCECALPAEVRLKEFYGHVKEEHSISERHALDTRPWLSTHALALAPKCNTYPPFPVLTSATIPSSPPATRRASPVARGAN